jgi:hypothetical protein
VNVGKHMSFPQPVHELSPDADQGELHAGAFEIMGHWVEPTTLRLRFWVRSFCTDSQGCQVGRDFSRVLDSSELVAFTCSRALRSALAIEPQDPLTQDDQERISEILRARNPSPQTLAQRVTAFLSMLRRKAGGSDRRAASQPSLFLRGTN